MKRTIAISLVLLLALGLAGCGAAAVPAGETPAPSASPEASAPETQETKPPAPDFAAAFAAYPADATVLTIDGFAVPWSYYCSVLAYNANNIYLYSGESDFSHELQEGYTMADWLREQSELQLKNEAAVYRMGEELGLSLTDEDRQGIEDEISEYAKLYYDGDREALFRELLFSEDYLVYQEGAAIMSEKVLAHDYGEQGANITAEQAAAWLAENEYLYAKHILFKTVDDAGAPLGEDEIAESRVRAEETLETLRAADKDALPALFDKMMHDYSGDAGALDYYPDGYFFKEGRMVDEFYQAALELAVGELSGLVQSSYGYHILYHPAPSPDAVFETDANGAPVTLRQAVAQALVTKELDRRVAAQTVTYAGDFAALDPTALFSAEKN